MDCKEICKSLVVYQFNCMVFYHSQMLRHVINSFSNISYRADTIKSQNQLFSVSKGHNSEKVLTISEVWETMAAV